MIYCFVDSLIQCRNDSSISSVTGSGGIFFFVTNSRYFLVGAELKGDVQSG